MTVLIATGNADIARLLEKDAYRAGFETMRSIITRLPVDRDDPKAARLAAVLCGIPANFVSGVILPPSVSEDPETVDLVREAFGGGVFLFAADGTWISVAPASNFSLPISPEAVG